MFIIAKYAMQNYPSGKASMNASIAASFSVRALGIPPGPYATRTEAESYLPKLIEFNPTVGYGVLELERDRPSDAELLAQAEGFARSEKQWAKEFAEGKCERD